MDIALFALWGAVGWCGTPYPAWWRGPRPNPDPEPWWLVGKFIGVVAGIIGGWAYTQVFGPIDPIPWKSALPAAASSLGAFVVARIIGDIISGASAAGKKTAAG